MEATHEFCSVSVLDGDEARCVARVAPARIMSVAMPVGTRLPAYATCVGALAGRVTVATLRGRLLGPLCATAESIERDLAAARP